MDIRGGTLSVRGSLRRLPNLDAIASTSYPSEVQRAIDLLVERLSAGQKLLVCGNCGSAADAMHICAELVGRFLQERRALPAIALSANQPVLTALSNDYSYEAAFARQVEPLAKLGDVGISTSGNSRNVVEALKTARRIGGCDDRLNGAGRRGVSRSARHRRRPKQRPHPHPDSKTRVETCARLVQLRKMPDCGAS
jgi:phosphoheptose isomerase